jgi:hypothetical protein
MSEANLGDLATWYTESEESKTTKISEIYLGDLPLWSDSEAREVMVTLCEKHNVPVDVLTDLVAIQRHNQDRAKAFGIYDAFSEVLSRMD